MTSRPVLVHEYGAATHQNEEMLGKTFYLMNAMSISGELGHFCVVCSKAFLMTQPFPMLIAVPRTYRRFRKSAIGEKIALFVSNFHHIRPSTTFYSVGQRPIGFVFVKI